MDKAPRLIEPRSRPEVASYDYWNEKTKFAQQALTVAVHRRSLSNTHNPDQLQLNIKKGNTHNPDQLQLNIKKGK